mgnify:CR=1 FL=1|tara:strand:+ start:3159 stop:4043 length:885 start_codon:yes stop_codon:yes gene_type:complete
MSDLQPQFPLYIPSKGRYEKRLTANALDEQRVPYKLVIEEQEYTKYARFVDKSKLLVLDKKYQQDYDTLDDLGFQLSKGPGAARNFIWDHSISEGYKWHWVMDDNIAKFKRFIKNSEIDIKSGSMWRAMEDFCLRYTNVGMAGPNYNFFVVDNAGADYGPFTVNTRIYSCNLIRNDIPFRWRGRYNEDTILSLDMLKKGWCTIQFNCFLQCKAKTLSMKGGNTDDLYKKTNNRLEFANMLQSVHPDVTEVKMKYGRWHHMVNYRRFKKQNKLIYKEGLTFSKKPNNYGLVLKRK